MTFRWPRNWTPQKFEKYKKEVEAKWDEEAYHKHRDIPNYVLHRELCDRLDELESTVETLEHDRDVLWEDNLIQNRQIARLNQRLVKLEERK